MYVHTYTYTSTAATKSNGLTKKVISSVHKIKIS